MEGSVEGLLSSNEPVKIDGRPYAHGVDWS